MKGETLQHHDVDRLPRARARVQENISTAVARLPSASPSYVLCVPGRVPMPRVARLPRPQLTIGEFYPSRYLSTMMPIIKNTIPAASNASSIVQVGRLGSKIAYRGANTNTSVPASRKASPTISSVCFLLSKLPQCRGRKALYHDPWAPAVSFLYSRFSEAISFKFVSRNRNGFLRSLNLHVISCR